MFSLEAPGRVADTAKLAGRFEQAMNATMECSALRGLLEVALVFGNTLNKGNRLGDARGITVDSILLFHEVKANSVQKVSG